MCGHATFSLGLRHFAFSKRLPATKAKGVTRRSIRDRCRGATREGTVRRAGRQIERFSTAAVHEGRPGNAAGKGRHAIVVAKFNSLVTKSLLEGALAALNQHSFDKDAVDVTLTQTFTASGKV